MKQKRNKITRTPQLLSHISTSLLKYLIEQAERKSVKMSKI